MKKLFITVFLFNTLFSFSQSDKIIGEYLFEFVNEKNQIEYRLNLKSDGTFIFHYYTNIANANPSITHKYGKGNWNADGKVVSFFSDNKKDFDKKHTLDFSNSRAHFITKPSRDKSDRIIRTQLKFFESKIFWVKGLDIFKI